MRLVAVLLSLGLANAAGADCLPEGKTPSVVRFADRAVIAHINRQGDLISYVSYDSRGEPSENAAFWGLYPYHSDFPGDGATYDWQGATLPPPADLSPGQEIRVTALKHFFGVKLAFSMKVRLIGPAEVDVGGCTYPVVHLAVSRSQDGTTISEEELWLDPARLVVWATTERTLDKKRNLKRETSSRAVGATE